MYAFGSESIGGDEPWENRADSEFLASTPSGRKFDTRDWPEELKQLTSHDDSKIAMTGEDITEHWNSTPGRMESISLTWKAGNPEESPVLGFGHGTVALAFMAVIASLLVLRRIKGR